jgi:hypothetical protein
MQNSCTKGRKPSQVTSMKMLLLKNLRKYYGSRRLKTGISWMTIIHSTVARIVTEYLEAEKGYCPPPPLFSPDLALCDFFLFPKLKFHLSGKRYKSQNVPGSAIYLYMMCIQIEGYKKCFQTWIDRLKKKKRWVYFEDRDKEKAQRY